MPFLRAVERITASLAGKIPRARSRARIKGRGAVSASTAAGAVGDGPASFVGLSRTAPQSGSGSNGSPMARKTAFCAAYNKRRTDRLGA
jgi:hypothetical protein